MTKNNDTLVSIGVFSNTREDINIRAEQCTAIMSRKVTQDEIINVTNSLVSEEKLQSTFKKIREMEEQMKESIYGGIE